MKTEVDQLTAIKSLLKDCLREVMSEEMSTHKDSPAVENAPRDCMDIHQIANYLQCSEQSIRNWQNRSDHPLPCGYVGDSPRYFRLEVEQWSRDEAARRKNKTANKGKFKQNGQSTSTIRATLTAAN